MSILTSPFITKLEQAERILIAGAGGGFDVFCGLPLYFALQAEGKAVYLANFSFTNLEDFEGEWITPSMMKVTPATKGYKGLYFPEWYLTQWLAENGDPSPAVYSFLRNGVLPLIENYKKLCEMLDIDTIVMVDGGTDSLMRGDEDGLGTPAEDLASITAVSAVAVPQKMLMCLGFGVDHYHGVSNDLTFNAIADLTQSEGFLGSLSLLSQMPEVQKYIAASEYVFASMPNDISIVSSSIIAAIKGHYGNHHTTERTKGSRLWINPLMPICWFFDLEAIVKRNLLCEHLYITEYLDQTIRAITIFRRQQLKQMRRRSPLPD